MAPRFVDSAGNFSDRELLPGALADEVEGFLDGGALVGGGVLLEGGFEVLAGLIGESAAGPGLAEQGVDGAGGGAVAPGVAEEVFEGLGFGGGVVVDAGGAGLEREEDGVGGVRGGEGVDALGGLGDGAGFEQGEGAKVGGLQGPGIERQGGLGGVERFAPAAFLRGEHRGAGEDLRVLWIDLEGGLEKTAGGDGISGRLLDQGGLGEVDGAVARIRVERGGGFGGGFARSGFFAEEKDAVVVEEGGGPTGQGAERLREGGGLGVAAGEDGGGEGFFPVLGPPIRSGCRKAGGARGIHAGLEFSGGEHRGVLERVGVEENAAVGLRGEGEEFGRGEKAGIAQGAGRDSAGVPESECEQRGGGEKKNPASNGLESVRDAGEEDQRDKKPEEDGHGDDGRLEQVEGGPTAEFPGLRGEALADSGIRVAVARGETGDGMRQGAFAVEERGDAECEGGGERGGEVCRMEFQARRIWSFAKGGEAG
jgi:hypothetical protein